MGIRTENVWQAARYLAYLTYLKKKKKHRFMSERMPAKNTSLVKTWVLGVRVGEGWMQFSKGPACIRPWV